MHYMQNYGALETAPAPAGDWKAWVIQTYQQHRQQEDSTLRKALVQRVGALTGRQLSPSAIWVELDERAALATVDGVRFRLERSQLTLLRPCALCGRGQFASPPLVSPADVGYAFNAWQPHHLECQPEDPVNWLND